MREAVIHPNSLNFSLNLFSAVAAGYISDSLFSKSFGLPPCPLSSCITSYLPPLDVTPHLPKFTVIYTPPPTPFFHKSSAFYIITFSQNETSSMPGVNVFIYYDLF